MHEAGGLPGTVFQPFAIRLLQAFLCRLLPSLSFDIQEDFKTFLWNFLNILRNYNFKPR